MGFLTRGVSTQIEGGELTVMKSSVVFIFFFLNSSDLFLFYLISFSM